METRLFFDFSLAFNGPASYAVQSTAPVSLPGRTARAVEDRLALLLTVLRRELGAWPVPAFPLRDEILAAAGPGERSVPPFFAGRFDIVVDGAGRGHVIELNGDRNGMQRESMSDPAGGGAFRDRYLAAVRSHWSRYGHSTCRPPNVAVVIASAYREESSLAPFYALLIHEGLGWPCVVAGVDNLAVAGDGRVTAFGQPVDLILRQYPAEYLFEVDCGAELVTAHRQGRVLILNDPGAIRLQAKSWMAVISAWLRDGNGPLSTTERIALAALLPFTASLADGVLPADPACAHQQQLPVHSALVQHQARWVLKPALGRYSWGVTCGALATSAEWREAVRHALTRPEHWVAQRYIEPEPRPLAHPQDGPLPAYVTYGVHVLDGALAGWVARCSRTPVTDDAWFAPVVLTD